MAVAVAAVLAAMFHSTSATGQTSADLGPAATTGQMAFDGMGTRSRALHTTMACGNELEFTRRFAFSKRLGKKGEDPSTPFIEKDFSEWPVTLMLGKAAVLRDPEIAPRASRARLPVCSGRLGTNDEVLQDWAPLASDRTARPGETAAALVNRVYSELFTLTEGAGSVVCNGVSSVNEANEVFVNLTRACLARQIRSVMSNPRHGPWHEENGIVTPEFPGTSAGKLPCLSEWTFKLEGVDGDWDMAVLDYTRLAHLLYAVNAEESSIGHDAVATLEVLNSRFLTLRSSPEQGATARESFNLLFSCGNLPNQFGSAVDTVAGTGSDPGVGRYNEDGQDAVEHTSFWKDLLRFLAALAIVVAVIVVAAIVGSIVAAAVGAGLGAAGAVAAVVAIVGVGLLLFGSIEETENHLLMQNSSRYLKNKLMMTELSQQGDRKQFDEIADLNGDLRNWLLERIQKIAEEDFVEYNAKPYARLSHFSLLNLIDFACSVSWDYALSAQMQRADAACDDKDKAIVIAGAAVFDLSAAKASVGSLKGRRLIPYRRLAVENQRYYDGRSLLELIGGADTMLAALQVWTGQMQFAPQARAAPATFGQLVFYSTSRYRPDPMILDMAVDKSTGRRQQYRHATREAYVSGNGWLITAGGTDERAAQGLKLPLGIKIFGFSPKDDHGVGVPTTLMTTSSFVVDDQQPRPRARVTDFLRFDGKEVDFGKDDDGNRLVSFSNNNCLAGGFACGLRPRYPIDYLATSCATPIADRFVAIDSTRCFALAGPATDIFVALYDHDGEWGFFEVVQRSAFSSIEAFVAKVKDRNSAYLDGWGKKSAGDEITYVTTDGRNLEFTPKDEDFGADRRACGVVNHESGARFTISAVPASEAANCRSVGRRIFIDLNDAENPIRKAEEGADLDGLF